MCLVWSVLVRTFPCVLWLFFGFSCAKNCISRQLPVLKPSFPARWIANLVPRVFYRPQSFFSHAVRTSDSWPLAAKLFRAHTKIHTAHGKPNAPRVQRLFTNAITSRIDRFQCKLLFLSFILKPNAVDFSIVSLEKTGKISGRSYPQGFYKSLKKLYCQTCAPVFPSTDGKASSLE